MSVHGSIILNGPFLVIYGLAIWIAFVHLAKQPTKKLLLLIGCILGFLNRLSAGIFYPLSSHMMETGEVEVDSYVQWISNWGIGSTVIEGVSLVLIIASAVIQPRNPKTEMA